jgi:hypothetical protein
MKGRREVDSSGRLPAYSIRYTSSHVLAEEIRMGLNKEGLRGELAIACRAREARLSGEKFGLTPATEKGLASALERVQLLARLEANGLSGGNADLSPGAGVAADAGFARADTENAESAQLNALAGCESLLKTLEDRIHGCFGLGARQAGALNHVMNDVLLNQGSLLAQVNWLSLGTASHTLILQILRRLGNGLRKGGEYFPVKIAGRQLDFSGDDAGMLPRF